MLDFLRPLVDAYKVDLKGMREEGYRRVGGTALRRPRQRSPGSSSRGFWVEVVTLVVPGHNDSDEELRDAARFLASLSPDLPWHVTAFHPDYRMAGTPPRQPSATLLRAAEIGREEGLRYVYAGNLPGRVGDGETTFCPVVPRSPSSRGAASGSWRAGSAPTAPARACRCPDPGPLGAGRRDRPSGRPERREAGTAP